MKRSLVLAILGIAAGATNSFGQATLLFQNYFTSTSPTINYNSNPLLAPPGKAGLSLGGTFAAEMAWFNGITTDQFQLSLVPSSTTYFSALGPGPNATADGDGNNGAGWFFGPVVTLSGAPAGSTVTVEVFAFNGPSLGSSTISGHSDLFSVTTGGGVIPPGSLINMPNFVVSIPEPSTFALAGLGAASLVALRRKRA